MSAAADGNGRWHAHPIEVLLLGNADLQCERVPQELDEDQRALQQQYRTMLASIRVADEAREPRP